MTAARKRPERRLQRRPERRLQRRLKRKLQRRLYTMTATRERPERRLYTMTAARKRPERRLQSKRVRPERELQRRLQSRWLKPVRNSNFAIQHQKSASPSVRKIAPASKSKVWVPSMPNIKWTSKRSALRKRFNL